MTNAKLPITFVSEARRATLNWDMGINLNLQMFCMEILVIRGFVVLIGRLPLMIAASQHIVPPATAKNAQGIKAATEDCNATSRIYWKKRRRPKRRVAIMKWSIEFPSMM